MKIGLITNSLVWAGMKDLDEIAGWAAVNGFEDMEVGPDVPLEEEIFCSVLEKRGIDISSLIYCRNLLCENGEQAEYHRQALTDRIVFGPKVGVKRIICSTGVTQEAMLEGNPLKYDPEASVKAVAESFKHIVELAERHNVLLCFENCPLMGNIAISPYMWDILFKELDSRKVGLVFDPSHMVWQFMDPYTSVLKYKSKIFHVHGKDCEVNYEKLRQIGILHGFSKKGGGGGQGENALEKTWWRYRLPGLGDLSWNKITANLQEAGFNGTISIEHEDPVWEGSLEKVQAGLLKAKRHIAGFL